MEYFELAREIMDAQMECARREAHLCLLCGQAFDLPWAWGAWEVCHACAANRPDREVQGLREEPSPFEHAEGLCQAETCLYCRQEDS